MGYIYLVTNKVNNKKYIGQSICKDIKSRWKQHKVKDSKTIGNYLLSAYNKYGIENFTYKIICICFDEDCNKYEEEYIKKYNTLVPNGYNLQTGGKRFYVKKENKTILKGENHPSYGKKLSEEQKKKLSERMKGINNPNYGKKMSQEQKHKISTKMTGKILKQETKEKIRITLTNSKHSISPEIKNKISKAMIGKKRLPLSEETKIKIREKTKGALAKIHDSNRKKVGKYDTYNNLIKIYSSIKETSYENNIPKTTLSRILNNNIYKLFNNFYYKFIS